MSSEIVVDWSFQIARWSLLASAAYLALIALILGAVLPASKPSPLPEKYFELIAAGKRPVLYRLSIAFDMLTWIALGGFILSWAGLLSEPRPIESLYVAALGIGLVSGFIGAGLRLVATPSLSNRYRAADTTAMKESIVESYDVLLTLINTLFNTGGLLAGIALSLLVSSAWNMVDLDHWILILLGLAGVLAGVKGALELTTGNDWGPLALLGNILMLVSFIAIAVRFW